MMFSSLSDLQLNIPTRDEEINTYLKEVREITKKDWQEVEHKQIRKLWFKEDEVYYYYGLYLYAGGICPYQVVSCVHTANECRCYLLGVLSGVNYVQTP